MSNMPKNQERGVPGGTVTLDAYFRQYSGGPLIDPDALPTCDIKDPTSTIVESGDAVKIITSHPQGHYQYTYSIPAGATISSLWSIHWNADVLSVVVPDAWEYFQVLPTGTVDFDDLIHIPTDWLNQIKKVLLFPIVARVLLTDDEIKEYCVFPALHSYFVKFPIRKVQSYPIGGIQSLEIDFPEQYTFGVVDRKFLKLYTQQSGTASFWEVVSTVQRQGRGDTMYSTPYSFSPGGQAIAEMDRQLQQTRIDKRKVEYFQVFHQERKVRAKCTPSADLEVTWANFSYDFDDIKHTQQFNVVKIAQSFLLDHLADTGNVLDDSGADKKINVDGLRDRAENLREEVNEAWNELSNITLLR